MGLLLVVIAGVDDRGGVLLPNPSSERCHGEVRDLGHGGAGEVP